MNVWETDGEGTAIYPGASAAPFQRPSPVAVTSSFENQHKYIPVDLLFIPLDFVILNYPYRPLTLLRLPP